MAEFKFHAPRLSSAHTRIAQCKDWRCGWAYVTQDQTELGIMHQAQDHARETGHTTDSFEMHVVTYGQEK
jgi:hypothetical protein